LIPGNWWAFLAKKHLPK